MDDEKLEREAAKIIFSAPGKGEEPPSVEPKGPAITFVCPFCNATYPVDLEFAGQTIACRNCRELSRVDEAPAVPWTFDIRSFLIGLGAGLVFAAVIAVIVVYLKLLRLL